MLALLSVLLVQTPGLVMVTPRGGSDFAEPQVAVEDDGHVYVAYGASNAIYISSSSDKGATFSSPVKVAEAGRLALGMRRGPRIAAYKGQVTITATYGEKGGGADGDLLTFRSTDHGQSWSKGAVVNDAPGAAREGLHAMAVSRDGTLACSWLDLRSKGTKLYMASSKDAGATWSKNRLVYESPSGSICECCHPSLAYDDSGQLTLMFRNSLNGERDMYVTSTSNDGQTFSPASKIGTGTWKLNACPMDGGMAFAGETDAVGCVWRREDTVYYSFLANGATELALGQGKQPWVANGPKGNVYVVWSAPNGIMSMTLGQSAKALASQGTDPVVSSSPNRKIVFAAWLNDGIQGAQLAQ